MTTGLSSYFVAKQFSFFASSLPDTSRGNFIQRSFLLLQNEVE